MLFNTEMLAVERHEELLRQAKARRLVAAARRARRR
jgi:hypothetical protein